MKQSVVRVSELEILHAGLGLLIARYQESGQPVCSALWISRQLRLIAEHPCLTDPGLKALYKTMAARWHVCACKEGAVSLEGM
jgi:hypothetical protein